MAKLKGYTTIEALISSVILLLVLSISLIVFLNVISSKDAEIKITAKRKLVEIALSYENVNLTTNILFEHYVIQIERETHNTFSDIQQITLSAIDNNDNKLAELSYLRKKDP